MQSAYRPFTGRRKAMITAMKKSSSVDFIVGLGLFAYCAAMTMRYGVERFLEGFMLALIIALPVVGFGAVIYGVVMFALKRKDIWIVIGTLMAFAVSIILSVIASLIYIYGYLV